MNRKKLLKAFYFIILFLLPTLFIYFGFDWFQWESYSSIIIFFNIPIIFFLILGLFELLGDKVIIVPLIYLCIYVAANLAPNEELMGIWMFLVIATPSSFFYSIGIIVYNRFSK